MISETYTRMCQEQPEAARKTASRARLKPRRVKPNRLTLRGLLHSETVAVEFGLSMISILCGVLLLMPQPSFSLPFPALSEFFSEHLTGGWLLMLGTLRLAALRNGNKRLRQAMAFTAWLTWLFLLSWVLVTDPLRLSVVFFAAFATASFWVFMRGPSPIGGTESRSTAKG